MVRSYNYIIRMKNEVFSLKEVAKCTHDYPAPYEIGVLFTEAFKFFVSKVGGKRILCLFFDPLNQSRSN